MLHKGMPYKSATQRYLIEILMFVTKKKNICLASIFFLSSYFGGDRGGRPGC